MKPSMESGTWNHKFTVWAIVPIYWVTSSTMVLIPTEVSKFALQVAT